MFTIDKDKLAEITRIINEETDLKVTEKLVEDEICIDEIADWIIARFVQLILSALGTGIKRLKG